jgi:hypothetical protein
MLKQIGMSAGVMKGYGTSRDFKAFLHGRRDGEVAVVNLSPKVKATEEAEIKE